MSNVATTKKHDIKSFIESDNVKARIKEILGKNSSSFMTSVLQISQSNELLKNAEPQSILGAALTATTLNLPLNNSLGFAYIVPFKEKQKDGSYLTKAQFQIGAKGFKQLAIRSGQFKTINETDVREGEIKQNNRMTGAIEFDFIQDDKTRESKKIIGYVSFFELTNGYSSTFYMSVEELEKHAKKYSQTYKNGFGIWKDNFDSMSKKTVSKMNLSKNAPLSIEMVNATKYDQAIINGTNQDDYNYPETEEANIVIDEKPKLTDSLFTAAKEEIKKGNASLSQIEEMYSLTNEQYESLREVENGAV